MLGDKPLEQWVAEYELSHQHPVNRVCHTLGIPLIAISILAGAGAFLVPAIWPWAAGLFVIGWVFQFLGHAVEGKPPEFFRDWRFLFVGLRWWLATIGGRRVG